MFALPPDWSARTLTARQFEQIAGAVGQHVFVAQLRLGLARKRLSLSGIMRDLAERSFYRSTKLATAMMDKAFAGSQWLDPRDRAVIETMISPATFAPALGPLATGWPTAPHVVAREVLASLHVDAGRVHGASGRPSAARIGESAASALSDLSGRRLPMRNARSDVEDLGFDPNIFYRTEEDALAEGEVLWRWNIPLAEDARRESYALLLGSFARLLVPIEKWERTKRAPFRRSGRNAAFRPEVEVYLDRPEGVGDVDGGCISLEEAWLMVHIPDTWAEQVFRMGYAVLDGRFVLSVLARGADERPISVRALVLACEPVSADPNIALLDLAEPTSWRFAVSWDCEVPVLMPDPDPELDWGVLIGLDGRDLARAE